MLTKEDTFYGLNTTPLPLSILEKKKYIQKEIAMPILDKRVHEVVESQFIYSK